MAYAQSGDFKEAIRWAKKALQLGFANKATAKQVEARLALYQTGKAYSEE